jgi:hypothetical protein
MHSRIDRHARACGNAVPAPELADELLAARAPQRVHKKFVFGSGG